jgi:predicted GNAT family N-acyltransferase
VSPFTVQRLAEKDVDEAVYDLLYDVLYRDFGVDPDSDWRHLDADSIYAVAASAHGGFLGVARLMPAGEAPESRQLRQLAVAHETRRSGVGRALVHALERQSAEQGAREVWLNARESAFGFYERLGYEFDSEVFVSELTGIPHRRMRKDVSGR